MYQTMAANSGTKLHGKDGAIYINGPVSGGGTKVANKTEWSLQRNRDYVDATTFGNTNKTYLAGLPNLQGNYNGLLDVSGDLLFTAASSGAQSLYLYADDGTNGAAEVCDDVTTPADPTHVDVTIAAASVIEVGLGDGIGGAEGERAAHGQVKGQSAAQVGAVAAVGAVETAIVENHAAVMVHHHLVVVHLFCLKLPASRGDLEQVAAHAITGGHIDALVVINGSGDDRHRAFALGLPEQLPGLPIQADDRERVLLFLRAVGGHEDPRGG